MVFIAVITVNAGLMYQTIIPAWSHLNGLTTWYWVLPYIGALVVMRNLNGNRALSLYLGLGMIMAAFLGFTVLDRGLVSYLIVDTLLLGACGILDLFWWSILGEMLDRSRRPARLFGYGLTANIVGILAGKLLALVMTGLGWSDSSVTIVALTVVCLTLMLLPWMNHRLSQVLRDHVYLTSSTTAPATAPQDWVFDSPALEPLTPRENDVLLRVLNGKTSRAIALDLSVSENTVKTHLRHIYEKYQVNSRPELFSMLLGTRPPVQS